jgi:hypothetical protein
MRVLHFIMSTIDFQGFQRLRVSESIFSPGAPASDVVEARQISRYIVDKPRYIYAEKAGIYRKEYRDK